MKIPKGWSLAFQLGWQDLKQSYRRSALGPFWLTLGMAVQILAIGAVFGLIFESPLEEFLPFLAVSIIMWTFISSSFLDGSMSFITSEAIIRQLPLPHYVYVLRAFWKNVLVLLHNSVILPLVFLAFLRAPNFNLVLLIPSLAISSIFILSVAVVLGYVTTRFRDMQQIMVSIMTVMFYVTPVFWQPNLIPGGVAHLLLGLNPLYHFLQILRLPLLGQSPTIENWLGAIALSGAGAITAMIVSRKFKDRLAYWV